ncbi:MAG: SAF domain-containing protein [Jatrophihabitans sp.]|uniref:SAF domain-containing protein n=1 Tax=Jatrophihabitans sp. TaxID=1932789 RepID=UPI003F8119EE
MPTTSTLPGASVNGRTPAGADRVGVALPTRQRRPGFIALAVMLIVGLAAVSAYLYSQAGSKTPVLMVAKRVAAGHPLTRGDITVVNVAGDVTAIGANGLDDVVGHVATVDLLPQTLLQRSMLTRTNPLPAGSAMVGVALKPGQLPATGLPDGAHVDVLQLPDHNAAAATPSPAPRLLAGSALVFTTVSDASQTGGTLATLVVPRAAAAEIAAASDAGSIALVEVAP